MLTPGQLARIEFEVRAAAYDYLHAADAETALGLYTGDAWAITNETVFSDRAALAEDIEAYFDQVLWIDAATWDDVRIHVIDENAATYTARLRYAYTDRGGVSHHLTGVWTALFVREDDAWKIRLRHETVAPENLP